MQRLDIRERVEFSGRHIGMPLVEAGGFDAFGEALGLDVHTHRGYELTYLFEGRVCWETATGEMLTLAGEDLAVVQPCVPHRGHLNVIQPASIFWLVVAPAMPRASVSPFTQVEYARVSRALSRAGNTVSFTSGILHEDLVRLHECVHMLTRRVPGNVLARAECRARIADVLLGAVRVLAGKAPERSVDAYAAEAVAYMKANLREPLSVADSARRAGVSPSRMHAVFRQRMGMTPNDYLQRLRIDTACGLLVSTDKPITRIALEIGFASSQYFATCFKKYTGVAPGEYRRRSGTT